MTLPLRLLARLTDLVAFFGGVGVTVMLVHIVGDVLSSLLLDRPLPATVEVVSRYEMVMIAFLALAWSDRRGGAISVDLIAGLLNPRLRRANRVFVLVLSALAYAILAWTTWGEALREARTGTFVMSLDVRVPVWPGYFVLPLSFGLACLVALGRIAATLARQDDALDTLPASVVERPE